MVVIASQRHEYQVQQRLALVLMAAHHRLREGMLDKDQAAMEDDPSQLKVCGTRNNVL